MDRNEFMEQLEYLLLDIPLFTAVLLKSIYEIALSYGFTYETEEEQCFILRIIENAFLHGERLEQADRCDKILNMIYYTPFSSKFLAKKPNL